MPGQERMAPMVEAFQAMSKKRPSHCCALTCIDDHSRGHQLEQSWA